MSDSNNCDIRVITTKGIMDIVKFETVFCSTKFITVSTP